MIYQKEVRPQDYNSSGLNFSITETSFSKIFFHDKVKKDAKVESIKRFNEELSMSAEFNLVYYSKTTGAKFLVKRVTEHDFIIMDPATNICTDISRYFLRKDYRGDKCNKKPREFQKLNFKNRKAS